MNLNIMVGGEAGQGVQSVGFLLAKAFARGGYHVFADQDYESRVRGGHNFYRVRISDSKVGAITETVDILLALNNESISLHAEKMTDSGVIVFNGGEGQEIQNTGNLLNAPLEALSIEQAGSKLMANTVAFGVAMGLIHYEQKIIKEVLQEHFGTDEIGEKNVVAAISGYDYAIRKFNGEFGSILNSIGDGNKMLLNGNEAIALGAIAAGCTFMAAYPMTPASSIMEYLAGKSEELGLVVIQPEDEISAINMAIGAAFAGTRAMTATSGGGFCLMVEGLGLAGMTETPLVVVDAQRPGPAIGLATRTEQSDLQFAIHASHGEFPRVVLAPANVEEAFWLSVKAFNLADKYQLPVILLTDQHLASSYSTVDKFDLSQVSIDRGLLYEEDQATSMEVYNQHKITHSGISPRAWPLPDHALVVTDSHEHDEEGHLTEDANTRTRMMLKRLRKSESLQEEIASPHVYGPDKAEITLIGWGSTYGALRETVDILGGRGVDINLIHFSEIWPFPIQTVPELLNNTKQSYVVENNATGQLAQLIRSETGIKITSSILKFDGRPFTPSYIIEKLKEEGI
ncbi:MAG: 2-oxoacid:acceptor oxidoreductase subunit alpha [Chloroflexi bacterium]|nr:2-oxoacid:acceptor oxidoreductase subunit alpha [Chloroflexota bacterium]